LFVVEHGLGAKHRFDVHRVISEDQLTVKNQEIRAPVIADVVENQLLGLSCRKIRYLKMPTGYTIEAPGIVSEVSLACVVPTLG
jgi:hypothetical protein